MRVGSLFSGIGGLDLGLERAGMSVVWQCESDPYCRAVLRKHWPDVRLYDDVRLLLWPPKVDVLAGGFPCQPVSKAGKRRGRDDDRWLWPEFARLIRYLRPGFVLVENVPGLLTVHEGAAFDEVLSDLAACGYDAEWDGIPAASVGAHHLRDRVFVVAYPNSDGVGLELGRPIRPILHTREPQPRSEPGELRPPVAYANGGGRGRAQPADEVLGPPSQAGRPARGDVTEGDQPRARLGGGGWAPEPRVGRVVDGLPDELAKRRIAALGNAVVPQVAEWIGRQIMSAAAATSSPTDTGGSDG